MSTTASAAPIGKSRWFRLIPIAMIVYIISFMDRTNIAYAFAGIGHDFHITKADEGTAGGIFFVGYVLLQIPGGWLAEHWSAKKFVAVMIVFWGLMALACGFAENFTQLVIARFFLGVAEGGIWPATLVLLSHWFPVQERARAYGFWIANLAISSIITQPLSGFIVAGSDWRTLFFVEGALPFIIALPLWLLFIKDRPEDASWCLQPERDYINRSIAQDRINEPAPGPFSTIFKSATVWRLVAVYFLVQVGFYGLNMWMPTLLKNLTHDGFGAVGLIAALPYIAAAIMLWTNGWLADRNRRYSWHVCLSLTISAISLILSVMIGETMIILSIVFLCLAVGGAMAYDGPFWAAASRTLPVALVGGAMGLINALGNLGGYLGPFLGGYLQDVTGNFYATAILFAVSLFAAGVLMLTVVVRDVIPAMRMPLGRPAE
ncbi:MFS transporter [Acidiphilium acidophilum]|uniref:MFS transporter n=1 Tax=Acidiphilium acidophilum TaxID=76588 RepID=A0AAW9DSR0_ACIAO|nr:MFS transporter [Acidiphilium acidophilum]MDX5932098.1 MFS transporter [Acidiphilium acidophilum]GBQ27632.1 major facilitator superfamily transporter [Acidiphilium acidophilum DSM 700]